MPEIINSRGGYSLDFIMVPSEHLQEFNDFMAEYGALSDLEIYNKMSELKGQISKEVLDQHIKNLDALYKMSGFVDDIAKMRIEVVKQVLLEPKTQDHQSSVDSNFFFGGTSLLLWFLILAGIWRRPFRRPGFGFW